MRSTGINGFSFESVVPVAMADVNFSENSVWNNTLSLAKEHSIVLAPSGSGKSSLVSFMYGSRFDHSGKISLEGMASTKEMSLKQWTQVRMHHISIVFQDLRLIPHLTVRENLLLKNKLTSHKTEEEIKHMVNLLGIPEKWNQTCATLSYGQQQRVAIVRSLLQPFDFLLADEPFSHLDDENIEKAKKLIVDECASNKAALVLFSLGNTYNIGFNKTYYL